MDLKGTYDADLDPEDLAFQRLMGPWQAMDLADVHTLFDDAGLVWWIAGGRAMEAFHGVPRKHEDVDVAIFRRDVERLRAGVRGRYHVWAPGPHGLCPLEDPDRAVPAESDQVWIREHAMAPWRADVVLTEDRDGRWLSRRDPDFDAPLGDVTWERDGIHYLRPEIALTFKASQLRPKDEHDFASALPLMSAEARGFLADYLARKEPGHPWQSRL